MLELTIPESEFYDSKSNKFITSPECKVSLEHSLISIAKWEAKWHEPYLGPQKKTYKQEQDYIRCMLLAPLKNDFLFESIFTSENIVKIRAYLDDSMTATTFSKTNQRTSKKIVTAEVIYCRMFACNIPMECQKWHLNRLLTLLRVCEIESGPKEKMSKKQSAERFSKLNAARRAKLNSRG